MFIDLIFMLSIRFFLFDFILFKGFRKYLKQKFYVFRKLLNCTYCQGFWCGLAVSLVGGSSSYWHNLKFAFISAIVTFTWTVLMESFIKEFEKNRDLPMT